MPLPWVTVPGDPGTVLVDYPDPTGDVEAQLMETLEGLDGSGVKRVVGPLHQSTWQAYRLVTWTDGSPPFLLESEQMFADPAPWRRAGFVEADRYVSDRVRLVEDARLERVMSRLHETGVRIRPLDTARAKQELRAVHRVSCVSFRRNPWYRPVEEEEFLDQYLPLLGAMDPDWVRVAECDGDCCGFVFAALDPRRSDLVVKTLAILPGRRFAGLGVALLQDVERRAMGRGVTHAIHALMHAGNDSTNLGSAGERLRTYHLFSRAI